MTNRNAHRLGIILLAVLGLGAPLARAATLTVDGGGTGDYLTIGEALDAATGGDDIQVLPGTYAENLIIDKVVTLQSTMGSASTTIDGPDTGDDVIEITVNGVAVDGFTLTGGRYGLNLDAALTSASLSDCTLEETGLFPVTLPPHLVEGVIPSVTLVPHASGHYDGINLTGGTIATSTTWPALTPGFVYYLNSATVNVVGAAGPVLTVAPGQIVKSWYSRFEIGSAGEPGGLMADGVTFTSVRDDLGGNTDGSGLAAVAGNWQRLDFNAMARSDSCRITNCNLLYGGSGGGVIHVAGSQPYVNGCTFSDNQGAIYVSASPDDAATLTGNTINQGESLPLATDLDGLDNLVFGNTIVPRGDDVYNGILIYNSTVTESRTLPVLPHDFCYYLNSVVINVVGAAGPVLTIPTGTIVKSWYSRFEIGSAGEPGGLVADGVTFTSVRDDLGGNTDGSGLAAVAGNWQRLDFNAMARADSCLITNCDLVYGGSGGGVIQVAGSEPFVNGCTFTDNQGALYVSSSPSDAATLTGNTINQGSALPISTDLDGLDNLVFGNTIIPRGDEVYDGIRIYNSTVAESRTLPVLPHDFCYYMESVVINVVGASGPVLTIPTGTIIKSWYSRFEIGSASQPGGLVADGVTFSSTRDDLGGNTDGSGLAAGAGNWQRLDFNAMARADSCLITNCDLVYGGSGGGVIQVAGSEPFVNGCTFTDNAGSLYVTSSSASGATLTGNTINQGSTLPISTDLDCLDNLVFGNTIVPRGDDVYNGIRIYNSTVTESMTMPTLPHGFVYFLESTTINVAGPAGPVLTIADGSIIKSWYGRFEIASAAEPGGLMAEGVTFTSTRDDLGGNTDGSGLAAAAGNWQRLDFNAMARADSCRLADCEFRYGGNGGSTVEVNGSSPQFRQCTVESSSSAGLYTRGYGANPYLWYCSLTGNDVGLRADNHGYARLVHCCFEGNATYGLQMTLAYDQVATFWAENCWWGAADGPSGVGPGSGDAVSDNVFFAPWATTSACQDLPVDVTDLPERLVVDGAHPNPFNPATVIAFALPADLAVSVEIYGLDGRKVAAPFEGTLSAGPHEIAWRGRDDAGRRLPSGLYFYRVMAGDEVRSGKMTMLK